MSGKSYFLGLMSGTSCDGLDLALVDIAKSHLRCLQTQHAPMPETLQQALQRVIQAQQVALTLLGELDSALASWYAECVQAFTKRFDIAKSDIRAIGLHGQTICHQPAGKQPFSRQLGSPAILAAKTSLNVVGDFRNQDIALGGQGAPLAPVLHQALFGKTKDVGAVVNIGGIANITVLHKGLGFDTGPGNTLLDQWIRQHQEKPYDENGAWAANGKVMPELLKQLLADPYFSQRPPKSTGREYFNLDWLQQFGSVRTTKLENIQATLLALTVHSISQAIQAHVPGGKAILICGGGVHNTALMGALQEGNPDHTITSTARYDVDPDFIEAQLMAYLAYLRLQNHTVDLTAVTGAAKPVVLGGWYA